MDHGKILESGTVKELVGRHFQERAVRFDQIDRLADTQLASIAGVASVAHEHGEVVLYTRDVPGTIAGVLAMAATEGIDPENLTIRRPTLEDVFLALTGRALRD